MRGICRATFFCMARNPYQRRNVSRRRQFSACSRSSARSTVIGWWQVPSSGHPSAITPSSPRAEGLVVVDHVELPGAGRPAPAAPAS